MSVFSKHIRAHTTVSPETSSLACLEAELLSKLNQNVRVDGRKADIFSIGKLIQHLAALTFDKVQTMRRGDLDTDFAEGPKKLKCYGKCFVPKDFGKIATSCQYWSADERLTADQLINKLVALEENTYGSTWVNNPQKGVTEEEQSDRHRQWLEVIGCTCTYDFCFWRDLLGQGAYGYVYKAKVIDAGTYRGNDIVAVKEVTLNNTRIKQMKQDGSWERAKEQWQKLVELRHPHLVIYYKVALRKLIQGASIQFMMDYCQGGDLDALIRRCKTGICSLSTEAVANYATQLASGLRFLHENQFIHGDLKPGNVFMDRATEDTGNRTLRIGDLDSAVRIRDNCARTERIDLAGTGPYMSPELVMQLYEEEHEDIGFATDIWSLGCVVLDLANCSVGIKERVFYKPIINAEGVLEISIFERDGFSADALLFQLSQGYHPLVSGIIRQDIKDAIHSCLEPACMDRPSAALFLEQLLCDQNGDPR